MQRKVYWNWFMPIVLACLAAFMIWKGYDPREEIRQQAEYSCDPSVLANGYIPKVCRQTQTGLTPFTFLPFLALCSAVLMLILRLPRFEMDREGGMITYHPFRKHRFAWRDLVKIEKRRGWGDIFDWDDGRSFKAWQGDVLIFKDGRHLTLGGAFTFGPFSIAEEVRRVWRQAVPMQTDQP